MRTKVRWRTVPGVVASAFGVTWRASRRRLVVVVALQVLSAVGAAGVVLGSTGAIGSVLQLAGHGRSLTAMVTPFIPMLVALGLQRLGAEGQGVAAGRLQLDVARSAQRDILDVATSVELAAFESPAFFNLLVRAQTGSGGLAMMVTSLVSTLASLFTTVALAAALVVLHPALLLLVFVACVPLWIAGARSARAGFDLRVRLVQDQRRVAYIEALLTGRDQAKEIRAFGLAPPLLERWERLTASLVREQWRLLLRDRRRRLVSSALSSATMGAIVLAVLWLIGHGETKVAAGTAAVYAIMRLRTTVARVVGSITNLFQSALTLNDFRTFLAMRPPITVPRRADSPRDFQRLEARAVSFRYPGADALALDDVSIHIDAGEVVALVGENGSGKTTLAKLLCQLYRPTTGEIFWDGVDTEDYRADDLRESIAVIFQDFVRYELSAQENVGFGRQEYLNDVDRLRQAAALAGAATFLDALPAGFETILSKSLSKGTDLSVGQWQRIALARAFFRDAPFIVLDEPTAAVDPRGEHELFERIRELARGRAVLLISHRFSTVRSADRIYVLQHGRVTEAGAHAALMAKDGTYAELFTLQAAAFIDQVPPHSASGRGAKNGRAR